MVTGALFGLAAVPAFLFIAYDLMSPLPDRLAIDLNVSRHVSEARFLMETPIAVELTLENNGPDIERLLLKDEVPDRAEVTRGTAFLLCRLGKGERVTLRYEVEFDEPGEYQFKPCSVWVRSMFGLAERKLDLSSPLTVRVYPRHHVRSLAPKPSRAFGWSGVTPSKFKGGRLDFVDIRQYVFGDQRKDINWKASGRTGKRLVNEWIVERGLDCIVVVDLSAESLPRVRDWSGRPDVINAAYELTNSLIRDGNRVGMLVLGGVLSKIRPGFGSRHLRLMVESLVDSREGMVWNTTYTEKFLEVFFRKQYRMRGGTLFFVFSRASPELAQTLKSLSAKGFVCNSILVDVLEDEGRVLTERGIMKKGDAEHGLKFARAEHEFSKRKLAAVSNVFVWKKREGFRESGSRRVSR